MPSFDGRRLVALVLMTATLLSLQNPSFAQKATVAATIEMRSDAGGVDFGPFMQSAYRSVKREFLAVVPASVEKGDKGIVSIQFRVQQDGKVPFDSLKIVSSSGKKEFDDAGLNAIRNIAPFDHLPSKFSQPFIELRMTFYYNTVAPKTT
jgi:TonB family protein